MLNLNLIITVICGQASTMEFDKSIHPDIVSMLILTINIKTNLSDNRSHLRCPALNHLDLSQILDDMLELKRLLLKIKIVTMSALISMSRNFELRDSSGKYSELILCVNYSKRISDNIQQIVEMLNTTCPNWEAPNHPFKTRPESLRIIRQNAVALGIAMELPNAE